MNKLSQKINLSSLNVLKTFNVIFEGDYSMNEILTKLNAKEPDEVFNNSVVSKYINTCRYIGMIIPKINNKYFLTCVPFGMNLSLDEIDLITKFKKNIDDDMTSKCSKIFGEFIRKINRYSNKQIVKTDKIEYKLSFELFERAVATKHKIKLLFKTQDILECTPIKIIQDGNKTFFKVFNRRNRMVDSERLSGIALLNDKFIDPFDGELTTIFKLSGSLAKRYEARSNEKVEQCSDGSIIVTNQDENKEILFSRLMRYSNLCEILKPKAYRDEFKQILDDTLSNYGM